MNFELHQVYESLISVELIINIIGVVLVFWSFLFQLLSPITNSECGDVINIACSDQLCG